MWKKGRSGDALQDKRLECELFYYIRALLTHYHPVSRKHSLAMLNEEDEEDNEEASNPNTTLALIATVVSFDFRYNLSNLTNVD
jgi:hypothetical protein